MIIEEKGKKYGVPLYFKANLNNRAVLWNACRNENVARHIHLTECFPQLRQAAERIA